METIRNYLETMFANLPNTEAVRKAKAELLQMMDDKYTELIEEGISENEAVGTVISEFGNLDELAEELGLSQEVQETKENTIDRRLVSFDEAEKYIVRNNVSAQRIALGVALCILSVVGPIIGDAFNWLDSVQGALFILPIAAAVGLFIYNSVTFSEWNFLKEEPCQIDINTANHVAAEYRHYSNTHALLLTIGIVLCVICWIPCAIFDEIPLYSDLSAVFLFILVAIGVYLIVSTNIINGGYETLLHLNDKGTISGTYGNTSKYIYVNDTVATVMAVYWQTVLCFYFIWSFISFAWYITWIVWPIAAIIHKVIDVNLVKEVE